MTLPGWTGALSGLSFLGTGATVLSQMGFALTRAPLDSEVVITLVFAAIPILLGVSTLLLVRKIAGEMKTRHRIYFDTWTTSSIHLVWYASRTDISHGDQSTTEKHLNP
jgi:cadmium resistance protein CadD (predicted permease)